MTKRYECPDDFTPDPRHVEIAKEKYPHVDLDEYTWAFIHTRDFPRNYANWSKAWLNQIGVGLRQGYGVPTLTQEQMEVVALAKELGYDLPKNGSWKKRSHDYLYHLKQQIPKDEEGQQKVVDMMQGVLKRAKTN